MTEVRVGVVDVCLLTGSGRVESVLLLRRAPGTRCTGSWEFVHGRIEPGESPEEAAAREVREETGFEVQRLYSVTVQPFYLRPTRAVQLAVVFAAFVEHAYPLLSNEHDAAEWLLPSAAAERLFWPRSRTALTEILHLLRNGDAGNAEDVLRMT